LVHPGISLILMTPICPHSLSFRPMLLPDSVVLKIQIPTDSRNLAFASFDGRHRVELQKGDSIHVQLCNMPLYSICKTDQHKDWFDSLSRCLHWNQRIRQKPFNISEAETMELGDLACKLFPNE
jgi:NAD kinase